MTHGYPQVTCGISGKRDGAWAKWPQSIDRSQIGRWKPQKRLISLQKKNGLPLGGNELCVPGVVYADPKEPLRGHEAEKS